MQALVNKCSICEESFPNWVEYQEHLNLGHIHKDELKAAPVIEETKADAVVEEATPPRETIEVFSSGRADLVRGPYPEHRMTEADKRLAVAKGEMRLGLKAFVGHA